MYGLSQRIVDLVIAHRGTLHCIERMDPERSALVVVDMQNYFTKPGFQAEIPAARAIVPAINRAARARRARGGPLAGVQTASPGAASDGGFLHQRMLGPARSKRRLIELAEGSEGYALWRELEVDAADLRITKRRYSAFIQGSSGLEKELRRRAIGTLLIAGTATNVCCESTARDAMMLNFEIVMLADALAALTPRQHAVSLENCLMHFGEVMSVDEALARMNPGVPA